MNAIEARPDDSNLVILRLCAGCGFILGKNPCLLVIPWSLGRASKEWLYYHSDKYCKDAVNKKINAMPKRGRKE